MITDMLNVLSIIFGFGIGVLSMGLIGLYLYNMIYEEGSFLKQIELIISGAILLIIAIYLVTFGTQVQSPQSMWCKMVDNEVTQECKMR